MFFLFNTEVSASEVLAILKKFVSKEATSEALILQLYVAALRLCFCYVIPFDLKLAARRKSATDLIIHSLSKYVKD